MKYALVTLLFVVACTGDDGGGSNNDPVCGDSVVEGSEQCDDGNLAAGDGCSASCTREPRCGDAIVDGNEECDDGNTAGGDGCSATCALECGNGVKDAGEECDDGNDTAFDGCSASCTTEQPFTITASWQIRTYSGTVQPCPTGYDTAAVYAQPIDDNGANVGTPIVDLFTCADGTGTTAALYEGRYKVYIGITDTNGMLTYATTPSTIIVLDANKTLSTTIYSDGGYFAWAWNLVGATSNTALTCAQAGANGGVELVSTLSNTTTSYSDIFTCTDGNGLTAALPAGTYTISADALNSSDQSIGTAPALTNKQIMAPNKVTDLGTVTIPIDGM